MAKDLMFTICMTHSFETIISTSNLSHRWRKIDTVYSLKFAILLKVFGLRKKRNIAYTHPHNTFFFFFRTYNGVFHLSPSTFRNQWFDIKIVALCESVNDNESVIKITNHWIYRYNFILIEIYSARNYSVKRTQQSGRLVGIR